jgi:hypothetical protein
MINLNSNANIEQFNAGKIKVESVLEPVNLELVIFQIPMIAWHRSISVLEDTLIRNIKYMINNHIVDLMVMMINGLQQKNGKYGKLR